MDRFQKLNTFFAGNGSTRKIRKYTKCFIFKYLHGLLKQVLIEEKFIQR